MRTTLLITTLLLSAFHMAHSQRICGSMEIYNTQIIKDSLFRNNRRAINILNERFTINYTGKRLVQLDLIIPVVVHVVYNTNDQKISMDQVVSQIKALNDDFGSRNADIDNVPVQFQDLIASDQGIKFQLARRDPLGNPTDGVVYSETIVSAFNSDNDHAKFTAFGGADAWPTDQYLNIWVCNLDRGVLGYAQFPGGPANTDGVVIHYTAFGTSGTAVPPFDKGRTATHEVGHWLNLYHIWGDDGNGCHSSDGMMDTPNQAGANYDCPTFPNISCNNQPYGDLFMNYMDYVNDECMIMFSSEQALRMRSTLQNIRNGLFSSPGLIDPKLKLQLMNEVQFRSY